MKEKNRSRTYYRETGFKTVKGADVTAEMLESINRFAQEPLTRDDVYVQKYIMAHNGIDRDRERFPEDLLEDYAETLPGKSFLEVHDKGRLPVGLYFDASTEEMSPERFRELTGEDIRLPEGIDVAKVVYGWIYTLRKEWNHKLIDNLKAGIYRHVSIGFSASDLKPVKGEIDQILYWEYAAPGESREGSIVYLGAQPGATIQQKDPDIQEYKDRVGSGKSLETFNTWIKTHRKQAGQGKAGKAKIDNSIKGGKEGMDLKAFLEKMSKAFDKHFDEGSVIDEIRTMIKAAGTESGKEVEERNREISGLKAQIEALAPLAEDGKAYRSELVDNCICMKAKLGDVTESEDDQKSVRATVEKFDIGYLKKENEILRKRVEERFPDKPQTKGDTSRDKSGGTDEGNLLIPRTDDK